MSDHQRYSVVFKYHATKEQIQEYASRIDSSGGKVTHQYGIMKGLAAHIPDGFCNSLQSDSLISYIEPDSKVTTQ